MENSIFSILTLPQRLTGNTLTVRFLVIPRNFSPLIGRDMDVDGGGTASIVFADDEIVLTPVFIPSLDFYPNDEAPTDMGITSMDIGSPPVNAREIFEYLATSVFEIKGVLEESDTATDLASRNIEIKKYIPRSFRRVTNFTPSKLAVVDDSYHCAFRKKKEYAPLQELSNEVSWGEVFAFILRQPTLGRAVGFIREFEITLPTNTSLEEGGWIFANLQVRQGRALLTPTSDSISKYASRIPLIPDLTGIDRVLFAANQFPVFQEAEDVLGLYGKALVESSEYDDGFAKTVHCFQPVAIDPLIEDLSESPPVHDMGLRLAWDDVQVLDWLNRQVNRHPAGEAKLIAPLGIFGYRIDIASLPFPVGSEGVWHSLCRIRVKAGRSIVAGSTTILNELEELEPAVEVHPVRLDPDSEDSLWLPMYFTQWSGLSLVITDEDGIRIHRLDQLNELRGPETEEMVLPVMNYEPVNDIPLRYGNAYQFRVRLMDLTGGGPGSNDEPLVQGPNPVGECSFKRYIIPQPVRVLPNAGGDGPISAKGVLEGESLQITRPLIGYPAVRFTGKYTDPVGRLLTAVQPDAEGSPGTVGLPDPDVDRVEILVEVKSLEMDNSLSLSGRDAYLPLYRTERSFPTITSEDDYFLPLELQFEYQDAHQLEFDLGTGSVGELTIDPSMLILPTGRDIRVTIRPLCMDQDTINGANAGFDPDLYYGDERIRRGEPLTLKMSRAPQEEITLFSNVESTTAVRGIYLSPDPISIARPQPTSKQFFIQTGQPEVLTGNMIERFAEELELKNKGLSLFAREGVHIQFGLSNQIRHTLGPDNASCTLSAKEDLVNQWIIPIDLTLNRDWSWSALKRIRVLRQHRFTSGAWSALTEAGTIEIRKTASVQSLKSPNRSLVRLCFFDAIDPKPPRGSFPDTIDVRYRIEPVFAERFEPARTDGAIELPELQLPVTTKPSQIPKIVSAGIALTPYERDETYSSTTVRRRSLWIEFERPPANPQDTYFVRFLAYAPDPWLTRLSTEDYEAKKEPPLPVPDEKIRIITPQSPDDLAGLSAMQEMIPSSSSDRHYLVPLPNGLHDESAELFGFFTYEIRLGHRDIWSTARGRFGRRIRVTGVQHPAPPLHCNTYSMAKGFWVSAPYATAVSGGKDITASPPRTLIRALLYAQVKMADGSDYRNILLDDRILRPENRAPLKQSDHLTDLEFRSKTIGPVHRFQVSDLLNNPILNKATYGFAFWSYKRISFYLENLGLPKNAPLSVICVELMPGFDGNQIPNNRGSDYPFNNKDSTMSEIKNDFKVMNSDTINEPIRPGTRKRLIEEDEIIGYSEADKNNRRQLTANLGYYRILRSSNLTKIDASCLLDC